MWCSNIGWSHSITDYFFPLYHMQTFTQARGVVLLAIQQAGLKVYSYKPMQVKQALVGYGNATKHQMMDMTKRLLGLREMPKPDDAADAIAIALCHARSSTSLIAKAQQQLG